LNFSSDLDAPYPADSAVSDLLARAYEDQAQSGLPLQNRVDALSPSPSQPRRASLNETERQQERDFPVQPLWVSEMTERSFKLKFNIFESYTIFKVKRLYKTGVYKTFSCEYKIPLALELARV
jgi:hypothetical protein